MRAASRPSLQRLDALDTALYEVVAVTPSRPLDAALRGLTTSANHSILWLAGATLLARSPEAPHRRAAAEGVLAIVATSATINGALKPLAGRRRPDRHRSGRFPGRAVPMPASTSFPSGHAGSAFAFACAAGWRVPVLARPLRALAAAVAYSRVHTGVHYPGDVVAGACIGAGVAHLVASAADRFRAG
jgi:undecaprenyl-diphosphatase